MLWFPRFSSVQPVSHVRLFLTPWTAARQTSLSITTSQSFLKLMSIKSVMPSNHLIRHLLLLLSVSQHQGLFQWGSSLHQVAKVLELQLQHQSFKWIFRTDFLEDCLVGYPCSPGDSQESSSIPQIKSISSSVLSFLYSSALKHPYMTTGKTIVFTRWAFVGKVISRLCNTLSRLVIAFLPRSRHLLISQL